MDDRMIIVSSDSHAGMPKEMWTEYLEKQYHDLIPELRKDNTIYPVATALLGAKKSSFASHPEHQEAQRTGWHGLHDPVLRLADMDREGIAAEFVFHGDARLGDLFHNATNRKYPLDAWDAGARAWNRWAADTFGFATDRFLLTAAVGPCIDIDATVAEVHWIADHGFTATYGPHYMTHPGIPPLFDQFWEPYWRACEERGIAIVVHAGFGTEQGVVFEEIRKIYDAAAQAAGSTDVETMLQHSDAVSDDSSDFFFDFVNRNVNSRRPFWQMVFGGVFDKHPDLRLMLTEIRLDWIPATLGYLDRIYDEHRLNLPTKQKPSEYWRTNCLAGASFIHKVEVEMRHEIGVENILFGRDFPHFESTWPHTTKWLQDAFQGVPENELRLMLGENAIRFFGLDGERLAELARRFGPTVANINATDPQIQEDLMENFDARGGYHKLAEGDERIPAIEPLVAEDLATVAAQH